MTPIKLEKIMLYKPYLRLEQHKEPWPFWSHRGISSCQSSYVLDATAKLSDHCTWV